MLCIQMLGSPRDSSVIARIQTYLPTTAANAWQMLLQRNAFLYITRGLLGFRGAENWPEEFEEGQVVETKLLFFNIIPAWEHRLHVIRIDHENMEIASQEGGGIVRQWDHRKWIENGSESSCLYVDEIDIDAGVFTFFIWIFAHVFYRYRQRRMRKLATSYNEASGAA